MADVTHLSKSNGSVPATEDTPLSVGTGARKPAYATISIPINTATSSPFQVPDHWRISQINFLASWIAADLALQTSIDNGATWQYADTYGQLIKFAVAAGCAKRFDNDESQRISASLIRFVSCTAASTAASVTTTNQTTAQTLVLSLISQ